MPAQFPTEFLFKRLPDFWNFFADREDVKNVWDAYFRKSQALQSLLVQADLSKSLKAIPIFDRNSLEYFVFSKLVRRQDLEVCKPFYVFEVDPAIFFIKGLNEKIDDMDANRLLTSPEFFTVTDGAGDDAGKKFLNFHRGVAPVALGETFWLNSSDVVTGTAMAAKVSPGDVIQGQNKDFFKVVQVVSDTSLKIQGPTIIGKSIGTADGVALQFTLDSNTNVIDTSVEVFVGGIQALPATFSVSIVGPNKVVTFLSPPQAGKEVTANYYRGYTGTTAYNRRTAKESIPVRLFSKGVYRDRRSVFRNFGTAIGLDEPTSFTYLNRVRGIYFARYNGPTISNMSLGSGILINVPFSERGKVTDISVVTPKSVTVEADFFQVPDALNVQVVAGQELPKDFNLMTDGVRTSDFINDPIFQLEPLKSSPAKFFTFFVIVKGAYAVHVAVTTGQPIDYALLKRFMRDIKPSYTDAKVLTDIDFIQDNLNLFVGPVDVVNALDAAATLEFNCVNYAVIPEFMQTNGFPYTVADETLAVGPVAAGLFATAYPQIDPGTFIAHAGTIGGGVLLDPTHYTIDLATGILSLTAAGATLVNAAVPPDIHVEYTSGLVGEAALAAMCVMDPDSLGLYEELEILSGEELLIDTLENNLVNFGTFGGPPPEEMDDDSIPFTESLQLNEAIGTPPASFLPPFTPGALIYTTP
jgi:hypothetical protein